MANWFKRNGIHLAVVGIFLVLCFVYFSPVIKGLVLPQSDVQQAQGMQREIMQFKDKDGKAPLWTNAMFGGMPAYQIWARYPSNITTYVISFFSSVLPNPLYTVLLYMLGAYLLFYTLRMNAWLAAAGAVAFAFTSYNFILIEAGHSNQALAIAFFAPIVAGFIQVFRKNYIMGAGITALALAIEIRCNHVQMTYYLFIALLIFILIELFHAVRGKTLGDFMKSIGWLAAAAVIAVGVNAGTLWTTYEYGQESIRGKSNLTTDKAQSNGGVDRDYAYGWSQGVGECITFLVPDAYGGGRSTKVGKDSEVEKVLTARQVPADQALGFAQQMPTYWGEKPFTSGPFYFGAIVVFLFIFGLFIVRDRLKWWILIATVLSLFLSFGRHLPFISDLFFNYFPLYNKFRTVESVLAIAGFLVPILAILAVKEVAFHTADPKTLIKKLLYSLYITGGILLIVLLVPTLFFSFKSSTHEQFVQGLVQYVGDRNFAEAIGNALVADRISIARMDALRSLFFVLVGAGLMWALIRQKMAAQFTFIVLGLVILTDLWMLDRRYLNNDNFVEDTQLKAQYQPREVDQLIMRDTSPDYRVLDLTSPDWSQSATATFFHNTVGGYHAAKLKRFNELLLKQFNGAINEDVLDMLNTKYVITNSQEQTGGQSQRIQNRASAAGNAWFVPQITYVKNADEEMAAINSFDPRKVAFVSSEFKSSLDAARLGAPGPNDFIKLVNYHPDHLTYEYSAGKDVFAVFSEIWYDKGWNAYVDGKKIGYVRANYVLRAAELPGGNHKLEFKFEPASYYTGEKISLVSSILLVLALGFGIYQESRKKSTPAMA
ncbi:YfhO family protein [Hufsiella ginkgonis]|uniref:YfhO family protein n=1 Tax=Hufsiella ginkgonis TaxID=2695274 RepID=A0A7K1XTX8_9SPHI|nr:YfhO family protein [Hufsiella ginkgonis]MXV14434.1 YfhO family protein [Hufsiella ginkgonis]